jgi:Mg2+-importing ATPase
VVADPTSTLSAPQETRPPLDPIVVRALQSDHANAGLSEAEAQTRLARYGPNEPVVHHKQALIVQLLRRFATPLVAILLVSSIASAALGDVANAAIIFVIVVLSVLIEFVQTRRSERAAEGLKAQVAQTATVRRDAVWQEKLRRTIVPGDVVRLSAGDLIPADGVLLESNDLHLHEAALTGESLPAEKSIDPKLRENANAAYIPAPEHAVFMGSSVVSGTALALVSATGAQTTFGEIARNLATRAPQSEFERGIAQFGLFILKTVVFLVLFVFVVTAALHKDPFESLLFAVALAVGLTPEFLPMITTVTLTRGAVRMAKQRVIVKNLAAIQNFGSIDILCSDKTGTLTTGEMTLDVHVDPQGKSAERPLLLAYLNSFFETGIENPVDTAVLRKARVDPIDSAVLRHEHPDITGFTKVDEVPFDFERRRVSVVVEREASFLLVTKGAPEQVLAISTQCEIDGAVLDLDDAQRARCQATFEALGAQGYRVLAVAYRRLTKRAGFSKQDEHDLVLAGYIAFADPPRADAAEVVGELRAQGITVKVLTGDSELVASHICGRVGIDTKHVLLGSDIDKMSEPALAQRAEHTDVFARVSPAQKNRILRALKARGHVVGYLGDGINDAPSLHAADVGISVAGATDVAKEAAEIILLEGNLRVLLAGVVEGRRAFGNVMKYLLMGTSSNFGNMFSMAAAAVMLPFLPMLPKQILLNNFLYDLAQVTIPSDNVDESFVRKPRKWDIKLIQRFMFGIGPVSSAYDFLTFYVLLKVFHAPERLFQTGWFVESLATQTLVIFVIRTFRSPFKSRPSRALTATSLAIVGVGLLLPFTALGHWLGFVPLPVAYFFFLAAATATYLIIVELVKRALLRHVVD